MARREEAEENYWPGYVDALSTIVMVVTFLLIILGIIIFVLSQKVAEEVMQAQVKTQQQKPNETAGYSIPKEGDPLTQDNKIEANEKLTVRSRDVKNEKQITVAPEEKPEEKDLAPVKVTASKSILSLLFPNGSIKVDENSATEMRNFLQNNEDIPPDANIEIRSFASSDIGAISEARRVAYYRGMSVRNELLKVGIEAKRVKIRVRETKLGEEQDMVKIFVKP